MMNNELRPYDKYKEANFDWLGEIPIGWELTKLSTKFFERRTKVSDKDYMPLSVTKKGIVPQLSTAAKSNDGDNRKLVKKGDFVINSRSDRKGSSGLSPLDGSVSLINIVLEPQNIKPEYAHYLFKSNSFIEEYYRNGRGIVADLWTTRFTEMKNIYIPIPSDEEQVQIVKYLDYKLAKINKFIKAKKKLINLFNEQIENMVYGYDFDSKSNEINSWENIFPEEWELVKTSRVTEEVKIKNCYDKELLAVTQDRGVVYKKDCEQNYVSPSGDLSALKLVRNGEYVISLRSFQGGIEHSEIEGIVSPAYNIFKLIDDYNNKEYQKYYKALFKTRAFISLLNTVVSGIRDGKNISYSDFAKLTIPIPPIEVAKKVSKLVDQYQNFRNQFEKENVLIQEFKSSLISNVVTGKIDVRNFEIENNIEEEFDLDEEIDYEESNEFIDEGGDE